MKLLLVLNEGEPYLWVHYYLNYEAKVINYAETLEPDTDISQYLFKTAPLAQFFYDPGQQKLYCYMQLDKQLWRISL